MLHTAAEGGYDPALLPPSAKRPGAGGLILFFKKEFISIMPTLSPLYRHTHDGDGLVSLSFSRQATVVEGRYYIYIYPSLLTSQKHNSSTVR